MSRNRNAPARKGEGAVCLLGRDTDAHIMTDARVQYLARFGLPFHRAALVAVLYFGEAANG